MNQAQPEVPSEGTIDTVLRFLDKPWKAIALIALAVAGVVTFALYEHRAELAEAILEGYTKPRLEKDRFTPKFASELLARTRSDLVVLTQITLSNNLAQNVDGIKRDDPGWKPDTNPRPLFYADRDPQALIALIEGRVVCRDISAQDGEEDRALAALNMRRRCSVAVPPVLDALVGGLFVAWRQPLPREAEEGVGRVLYQAASSLATW